MMIDVPVRTAPNQAWEKQPLADVTAENPVRCSQPVDEARAPSPRKPVIPRHSPSFPRKRESRS